MEISIYVDGAGGENSGYGFFIKETGESFYENKSGLKRSLIFSSLASLAA